MNPDHAPTLRRLPRSLADACRAAFGHAGLTHEVTRVLLRATREWGTGHVSLAARGELVSFVRELAARYRLIAAQLDTHARELAPDDDSPDRNGGNDDG